MGNDYSVPVDQLKGVKNLPHPPNPMLGVKCQLLKHCTNNKVSFYQILHTDRGTKDLSHLKHIYEV